MIYKNYSQKALYELEKQRTCDYDFYEENEESYICDECRGEDDIFFEVDSKKYCSCCLCDYLREQFSKFANQCDEGLIDSAQILNDIISDFSDNELICYIENRYKRIDS